MSTRSIRSAILLNKLRESAASGVNAPSRILMEQYPSLNENEAREICELILSPKNENALEASLVTTAPPSFLIRTKPTKITVDTMIRSANSSILITGYSLSEYLSELIDCLIQKSQQGVFVKFFVNHIEDQKSFERVCRYKGRFLRIYNYPKHEDTMAALHAKVISIDQQETLITSANLSYHGHEGNIELGTHIISKSIAKQVDDFFTQLIFSKVFEEFK